jgi:CubicO group peptidase (beta-lactamase class C family)
MVDQVEWGKTDELFVEFESPGSPGCALGVIVNGELAHKKGFGLSNLEYDIPITPATVFHVASMSKQFTAMTAFLLEELGEFSLDDSIDRYLPRCPYFASDITIKHLIHHTSGLKSDLVLLLMAGWRLEDVIKNSDVMELFRRQQGLNFQPGEQFSYSGTGYLVLASIIEQISGQTLNSICQELIFKPLSMSSTFFNDDYLRVVKDRAYAYYKDDGDGYQKAVLSCNLIGGTGLYTSIEDFTKWDRNFYTGEVGSLALVEQMYQRAVLNDGEEVDYGGGLFIENYAGCDMVAHGGDGAGIHCFMMRFPNERFTVVVLGNNSSIKARQLAYKTADLYLGVEKDQSDKKIDVQTTFKLNEEQLLDKVGRYYDEDSVSYVDVEIQDGSLRVWGHEVLPESENKFIFAVSPTASASFDEACDRKPGGLTIDDGLSQRRFLLVDQVDPTHDYLNCFEGSYYSGELDVTWRIVLEEDDLIVYRRRQGKSRLNPIIKDVFSDDWMASIVHSNSMPATLAFDRDFDQSISGFRISDSGARVRNIRFDKIGAGGVNEARKPPLASYEESSRVEP